MPSAFKTITVPAPTSDAGRFGGQNPLLVPRSDPGLINAGAQPQGGLGTTITSTDQNTFLTKLPRANATVTATFTGTITNLDTAKFTFTSKIFSALYMQNGGTFINTPSEVTAVVNIVTADTLSTVAAKLQAAIAGDAALSALGVTATVAGTAASPIMTINWPGPVGNLCTVSAQVTGAATEVITMGNAGVMAGGSGPIIPWMNKTYALGDGTYIELMIGQPYLLPSPTVGRLVGFGALIV